MKPSDYIIGYILPLIVLSAGQSLITGVVAIVAGTVQGSSISFGYMLLSILISLPSIIMYVSFGLLFGALVNKNAAPGIFGNAWRNMDGC